MDSPCFPTHQSSRVADPPTCAANAACSRRCGTPPSSSFVLLGASLAGSRGVHPHWPATASCRNISAAMAWEWMLTGFVYLGIRKRIKLRDLIGGRWAKLRSISARCRHRRGILAGRRSWCLASCGQAHAPRPGRQDSTTCGATRLPRSRHDLELLVWFCLSIDRGLLRRNHLSRLPATAVRGVTRSMLGGRCCCRPSSSARLTATKAARACCCIGIYGLMFGLLAWWRKSLRPGMIAHAWHDALSGAVLRLLK